MTAGEDRARMDQHHTRQRRIDVASRKTINRAEAMLALAGNAPCVPLHFQPEGLIILAEWEFLNPSVCLPQHGEIS